MASAVTLVQQTLENRGVKRKLEDDVSQVAERQQVKKAELEPESEPQDDCTYEVEAIVSHMEIKNSMYYYIKWKGFPDSENTWEPKENAEDCPDLVKAYWSKHKKKQPKKKAAADTKPAPKKPKPPPADHSAEVHIQYQFDNNPILERLLSGDYSEYRSLPPSPQILSRSDSDMQIIEDDISADVSDTSTLVPDIRAALSHTALTPSTQSSSASTKATNLSLNDMKISAGDALPLDIGRYPLDLVSKGNIDARLNKGGRIDILDNIFSDTASFSDDASKVYADLENDPTLPPNIRAFYKVLKNAKGPAIKIYNDVDNVGPPTDFTYIDNNIWTENVPRPSLDAVLGCDCKSCYGDATKRSANAGFAEDCGCAEQADCIIPYDNTGRVIVPFGTAIYECNHHCQCGPTCPSRVVQKGRKAKLEIFRTRKKGWGVRAAEHIKKGQFICEYVGEIITAKEAEQRAKLDETFGTTYLFDLDFDVGDEDIVDYTIDSRFYGNISHFFNHSCSPNVHIRVVFIEHWDKRLHRLAFFAAKDIRKGGEVTFDYNPNHEVTQSQQQHQLQWPEDFEQEWQPSPDNSSSLPRTQSDTKKFNCHCGSRNCRGTIFV